MHAALIVLGRRWERLVVATTLGVALFAVSVRLAVPTGGEGRVAPVTFAGAGIGCGPSSDATEQVFMDVDATDKEIIVARVALASLPGVTIDRYLDRDAARAQLACIFPGSPAAVRAISSRDLSVSFAITVDGSHTDDTARVRAIPNVLGVVTPATWSSWVARLDG